ncbi:hypothetical protein [Streptomyces netropsis]|uniref:Uncharacterized protein n=1 Tax=Streptomyces netropsis TaxID=55404 RepID=A0A7W7L6M5_STRNE|nr:hypothetical protein [Streptomyces netropsis]MBB4884559.1 hypothetical protein [Streptomyces netropsis]GGR02831.1 hypothetical protein GCM10010219_03510 [Streptomyces netropsis]
MNRAYRLTTTAALAAALVAGAAATATAAAPAPTASVTKAPAPTPALTAQPSTGTVAAWQEFRVSGKATGIKTGTRVTLQQKQGAKWVSLPASVTINKNSAYSMRVKLGIKGKNALRITGGGATSPEFTVTVR